MRLDPAGASVAAERLRLCVTLLAFTRPPAADAGSAHPKPFTSLTMAQTTRHGSKNTNPKID